MATEFITTGDFPTKAGRGQRSRLATTTILTRETGPQFVEQAPTAPAAQRIFTALGQLDVGEYDIRRNLRSEILSLDTIKHMNANMVALTLIYLNISGGSIDTQTIHSPSMTNYVERVINAEAAGATLTQQERARRRIETLTTVVRYARNIIEFRRGRQ